MSDVRALKRRLAHVARLWEERDYDAALAEVEALLVTWPGNAHLHVLKANLLQLQEDPKHELDDAKLVLQRAVELDRSSPAATIELGHFLDSVEDDPQSAVKAFAEGVASARRCLVDGLIGQAKAYRQLEKKEEFLRCVLELLHLVRVEGSGKLAADNGSSQAEQVQELLVELDFDRPTNARTSRRREKSAANHGS